LTCVCGFCFNQYVKLGRNVSKVEKVINVLNVVGIIRVENVIPQAKSGGSEIVEMIPML
jgi:hypothetical protein